jgi:hypothetical protein
MEHQVCIHLAGGIAEAVYRGERRPQQVLAFGAAHCCIEADLEKAASVLREIGRLTCRDHTPEAYAGRTLALMLARWDAVEALAGRLAANGRLDGADVERIIDRA